MHYLLLASFSSLLLSIVFKLFKKYEISHNQAIVVNYIVCVITGCITLGEIPFEMSMLQAPWMPLIVFLGFLFMGGFNVASRTVQYFGMAISSVAQRMSMAVSGGFAILYFNESYTIYKIIGILIALLAVVFINVPNSQQAEEKEINKSLIIFPIAIFFISAVIEIALQYLHTIYQLSAHLQSIVLFASAATVGTLFLIYKILFGGERLESKNILAGIAVGVPNYFSIYYMLCALELMGGSMVYSLNNTMIVISAAVVGMVGFKEKLSTLNLLGIGMAIIAILLITI